MAWEAKSQCPKKPLDGQISVSVRLYWPDARKRDLDNIKGLLDSFTGVLWGDDSQIVELHIRKEVDRNNPRVEIVINS